MSFWKRKPSDRITADALADFGRHTVIRAASGVADGYALVSPLVSMSYPFDGPGAREVIAELRRHATKGEWEKVGAWKYVREFLGDTPEVADLIDGGLLAIHRMRVTNLALHLAPVDAPRYAELVGAPPPNDGFFGPPVFDSEYGPTRQYYLDQAGRAAAARQVRRLPSTRGVEPENLDGAARAMWDFALLVYRGPLLVSPERSFEPNVVKPAADAARGVDHHVFAKRLADAVLDEASSPQGPWPALGAARFIEDYLDPEVAESPAWARAADAGLAQLEQLGYIGFTVSPETLTTRQRTRLASLTS